MTSPIEELALPYGVTVQGDGSWYPKIVGSHPNQVTDAGLSLPPGPCRVAISWDGQYIAELAVINGTNVRRPVRLKPGTVGVPRSAMVTIGARAGDRVEINARSNIGETGTIEVYPMPT